VSEVPQLPHVGSMFAGSSEFVTIPKDRIRESVEVMELCLGYMSQVNTEVPQWKKALEQDKERIKSAIHEFNKFF